MQELSQVIILSTKVRLRTYHCRCPIVRLSDFGFHDIRVNYHVVLILIVAGFTLEATGLCVARG